MAYLKEEVLGMLSIAAVVIGRQIVSESLAVDEVLGAQLWNAAPEGRA